MSISGVRLPCLCVYIIGIGAVKGGVIKVKGVKGDYESLIEFIEDDGVGVYESGFRFGFYC